MGNGATNATDPSGLEEDPAVTQMRAQLAAGNYAEYARLQERRFGATVQESPRNSRKFKVARLSPKILVAPRPPASPVPPPISDLPPGLPPLSHEVIIVLEYSPSRDRTQEHLDEMANGPWYTLTGIGSKLFGWTGMGRALELDAEANVKAYENLFYLGELKAGANRHFSEGAITGITFVASVPPFLIQIGVPGPEDIYLAPVFKYLGKTGMKISREAGEFVLRHQKTGELARGAVVIMRKLKDAIPTRMLDDLFRRFRGKCDAPRGGVIHRLSSSTNPRTGVGILDDLIGDSARYADLKRALENRGIQVIERVGAVDEGALAQMARLASGKLVLYVDPTKTRYIHVQHEWRHLLQHSTDGKYLGLPTKYHRYVDKAFEIDALEYELALARSVAKQQGTSLNAAYVQAIEKQLSGLRKTFFQKWKRSPTLQRHFEGLPLFRKLLERHGLPQ